MGFPGGSVVKPISANIGDAEDLSLIPGLGRYPRGGNDSPLQYSFLKNPMNSKIKPVNPKGNRHRIFIERTDAKALILGPPDAKS